MVDFHIVRGQNDQSPQRDIRDLASLKSSVIAVLVAHSSQDDARV
jgi:hypothetical protein